MSNSPHYQFNFTRALDILQSRSKGISFSAIAKQHGVTKERIRQIYRQVVWRGGMKWVRRGMREAGDGGLNIGD